MTQVRIARWCLSAVLACALVPTPASAQDSLSGFLRDVGGDYKHFVSTDTLLWLSLGGSAALVVHAADDELKNDEPVAAPAAPKLKGGQEYGGVVVQVPLAVGWWIIGDQFGEKHGAAGRDLLRAQISAASWTYTLKYIVNRTRPNGDPRSFPSGHASATFATATVLRQHYGWKAGAPAYAAAVYAAASRIADNKHWASDVVFGGVMGIVSARTVTIRLRKTRLSVAPITVRRGGGVLFTATRLREGPSS